MSPIKNNVYTVSQLNGEVRQLLEEQLGRVWLNAEISNFTSPSSGHWYLTLKDNHSQIRSAMFKGRNSMVRFRPVNGQQVLVSGTISVYEPRGDYQLIIDSMQHAGDGMLAQEFEALKMKLASEGLFATETKRPLPSQIQRIGVITSPTGAAIRDVLNVLKRRDPSIEVVIYPTQVQGTSAGPAICQAIELANARNEVDVLLLTRGGGSLEDLWCFNNEQLAWTIYNSALVVVSAVGHEIDVTISDYVADVRAPTPSAGAELLSKDSQEKANRLKQLQTRLTQSIRHVQLNKHNQLIQYQQRLHRNDPARKLQQFEQRFDEMQFKLQAIMAKKLTHYATAQQQLAHRLNQRSPSHKLSLETQRVNYLHTKLNEAAKHYMVNTQKRFEAAVHQLETVSPLATLSRGYSITHHDGKVLLNAEQVNHGDELTIQLKQGQIKANAKVD